MGEFYDQLADGNFVIASDEQVVNGLAEARRMLATIVSNGRLDIAPDPATPHSVVIARSWPFASGEYVPANRPIPQHRLSECVAFGERHIQYMESIAQARGLAASHLPAE